MSLISLSFRYLNYLILQDIDLTCLEINKEHAVTYSRFIMLQIYTAAYCIRRCERKLEIKTIHTFTTA